ncbi:MAG: hypothetical protein KAS62_09030 [Candidatus Delongbacteria bacterium]|nr:hypothetical protein [Candidatus Delongbacteria bacterium]
MAYIPPNNVISPQDSWSLNCVIYDEGKGGIAVSFGQWDGNQVIAMRWNGTDKPHKGLGNPQSSGHPTWFILPLEIGISVIKDIIVKQATGNTHVNQQCLTTVINWLKNIGKLNSNMY